MIAEAERRFPVRIRIGWDTDSTGSRCGSTKIAAQTDGR